MTSIESHRRLYGGAPRPHWAGAVQAVISQKLTGSNRLSHNLEFSGLVLPISVRAVAKGHTYGQSLGFPHLGEQLPDMSPEFWKNWGHLERVVGEAASALMGWGGPQPLHRAVHSSMPENALRMRLVSRSVLSRTDDNRVLQAGGVSGEINKMFNIRDVSGTQHRFESAGASAMFTVTPGAVHWSRDPRSL